MQISSRDATDAFFVFLAGMATQAIWLFFVSFYWGYDTLPNLAIGRMYFGLPYEMWSIKSYYPPAYPIFLTLLGVHHFDTLTFLRIGTWFVGGLMPLFLYLMLRPFNRSAALVAAFVFAASFANALFSTDMMNHHFHAFLLLFMSMVVASHLDRPRSVTACVLGFAAAVANTGRDVTMFVFGAAVVILSLAVWIERRNVRMLARSAVIMVGSFIALMSAFSVTRHVVLGEPLRFGLTYDIGARALLQGTYYGASIYQKEFHPGDDFVFVKPENGPASKAFFDAVRAFLANADLKGLELSDSNDVDEALQNVISEPNVRNTYTFWSGMDTLMKPTESDRLWRNAALETVFTQPRILRYHIWNFWNYLFGPPLLNEGNCVKCRCPPCFAPTMLRPSLGEYMGAEVFSKVAGPQTIAQMAREHERAKALDLYASYLFADVRLIFLAKPVLVLLLFASVVLTQGKMRFLMIYCVVAVCIIGGTTSLAWPVQVRYQYPALPYVFAGAAVSLFEIIRRLRAFVPLRYGRRELVHRAARLEQI